MDGRRWETACHVLPWSELVDAVSLLGRPQPTIWRQCPETVSREMRDDLIKFFVLILATDRHSSRNSGREEAAVWLTISPTAQAKGAQQDVHPIDEERDLRKILLVPTGSIVRRRPGPNRKTSASRFSQGITNAESTAMLQVQCVTSNC